MKLPKKVGFPMALGVLVLVCIGLAWATPPKQDRMYGGGREGPVLFSYSMHATQGDLVCSDCHSPKDGEEIFESRPYEFTLQDHFSGQYCWTCHNGEEVDNSCGSCHY